MNLEPCRQCLPSDDPDDPGLFSVACVAADFFPVPGGAEIEQASEKCASEGARLG